MGYLLALTYWVRVLLEEYDSAQLMAIMCIFMYSAGQNTVLLNSLSEVLIYTHIHIHTNTHILYIHTHTYYIHSH